MKYISEKESRALIDHEMAFSAVWDAFIASVQPETHTFNVVQCHGSNPRNKFGVKASATNHLAGLKVGSYWASNSNLGLPCHNSLILLIDQRCGKVGAAIEAGTVNAYRTAAANAVATTILARKEAKTLAIFGTGHQARFECYALARIRKITRVMIVGRDKNKAQQMADDLEKAGLTAEIMDAENACRVADIIVTATSSRAPLFEAHWIKPGTHISAMGADAKGKQELPLAVYLNARLFCDLPEQSCLIGEFQHAPQASEKVAIGSVILEKALGRLSEKDITVFDSSGLSIQDLFIGKRILEASGKCAISDESHNAR